MAEGREAKGEIVKSDDKKRFDFKTKSVNDVLADNVQLRNEVLEAKGRLRDQSATIDTLETRDVPYVMTNGEMSYGQKDYIEKANNQYVELLEAVARHFLGKEIDFGRQNNPK